MSNYVVTLPNGDPTTGHDTLVEAIESGFDILQNFGVLTIEHRTVDEEVTEVYELHLTQITNED